MTSAMVVLRMDSEMKIIIVVASGILIFTIALGFLAGCLFGVWMSHHMLAEMIISLMTGVHIDVAALNIDINETLLVDEMIKHMPEAELS